MRRWSRWTRFDIAVATFLFLIAASSPLTSYVLATRQARHEALVLDRFRQVQVGGALHREHLRDIADCVSRNQIRSSIVGYLDLLAQGAGNQAGTTVASQTATPAEKTQARETLDALPGFSAQAHRSFKAETCPKP